MLLPELQEHQEPRGEFAGVSRSGSELIVEATCGRFGDKTTLFLRDISERRRTEESKRASEASLRRTESKLAEAAQLATASELAASIVHEVNQPLSAIVINGQACLRWLRDEAPNVLEGRAAAERIVRDSREVGLIISGLRSMFSHSAPERADLSLRDIADEVTLLTRSKAQHTDVTVQIQLEEDLPLICGDKVQLQQVFTNLILNAIEAMQDPSIPNRVITFRAAQEQEVILTCV